jgi:DNA-binding XRE family transcriptional regulator
MRSIMDIRKQKKLEAGGWNVGTADEFLGLTATESAFVEMKVQLSRLVREQRIKEKQTQTEVAALVGSSQSRVAKMEAGDVSVSLDLLVRTALNLGASPQQIAAAIRSGPRSGKSRSAA